MAFPVSAYRTVAEALNDPQIVHRGALSEVRDGGGTFKVLNLPFRMSGATVSVAKRMSTLASTDRCAFEEGRPFPGRNRRLSPASRWRGTAADGKRASHPLRLFMSGIRFSPCGGQCFRPSSPTVTADPDTGRTRFGKRWHDRGDRCAQVSRKYPLVRHLARHVGRRGARQRSRAAASPSGLAFDIPGFDPWKVAFTTPRPKPPRRRFSIRSHPRRQGDGATEACAVLDASDDFKTWTFKLRALRQVQDGTPFNAEAVKTNFRPPEGLRPINAAAPSTSPTSTTCRRRTNCRWSTSERFPAANLPAWYSPCRVRTNVMYSRRRGRPRATITTASRRTGPYVLKSGPRATRMVLEKNPDYWTSGTRSISTDRSEAAAGRAVALRQPAIGRGGYHLGRRGRRRHIQKAQKDPKMTVPFLSPARAPRSTPSTPTVARSTMCGCARRW